MNLDLIILNIESWYFNSAPIWFALFYVKVSSTILRLFSVEFVLDDVLYIKSYFLHFSLLTSNKNWLEAGLGQGRVCLVLGRSNNIADKPIDNKRDAPHPAIIESISHKQVIQVTVTDGSNLVCGVSLTYFSTNSSIKCWLTNWHYVKLFPLLSGCLFLRWAKSYQQCEASPPDQASCVRPLPGDHHGELRGGDGRLHLRRGGGGLRVLHRHLHPPGLPPLLPGAHTDPKVRRKHHQDGVF